MGLFGIATKGAIIKDDRLLVIYKSAKEAATDPNPDFRRDFPGGRLSFGETPQLALLREIREEVGCEAKVIAPIEVWHYVKDDFQLVGITYYCQWLAGNVTLSEEHERHEWLTLSEIKSKAWEDIEEYITIFNFHHYLRSQA